MSKIYKSWGLIKAIADGEIKEDTKFREMVENRYYIFKGCTKCWTNAIKKVKKED